MGLIGFLSPAGEAGRVARIPPLPASSGSAESSWAPRASGPYTLSVAVDTFPVEWAGCRRGPKNAHLVTWPWVSPAAQTQSGLHPSVSINGLGQTRAIVNLGPPRLLIILDFAAVVVGVIVVIAG
jgi:hypothetical protein